MNKIEKRVIVLVLAVFLAAVFIRWRQVGSSRVELTVVSEEAQGVQR